MDNTARLKGSSRKTALVFHRAKMPRKVPTLCKNQQLQRLWCQSFRPLRARPIQYLTTRFLSLFQSASPRVREVFGPLCCSCIQDFVSLSLSVLFSPFPFSVWGLLVRAFCVSLVRARALSPSLFLSHTLFLSHYLLVLITRIVFFFLFLFSCALSH